MEKFTDRTEMMLGEEAVKKLSDSHVAVFGIGGVGGYAVEALARAGVGRLTLIDADKVATSNLNRQIIATRTTLGMPKVEAARSRILDINPECVIETREVFFDSESAPTFDFSGYDYVIDAIDSLPTYARAKQDISDLESTFNLKRAREKSLAFFFTIKG